MKILSVSRLAPLALGTALLVGSTLNAHADSKSDLRLRTQKHVQSLLKSAGASAQSLNLSAAQKAKMVAIARKNRPLIESIWKDQSLTQSAKANKVRALENQANAVLTPAQKQKLAEAKGEATGKMFQTALWISSELKLSPDQQDQLKDVVLSQYCKAGSSKGQFGTLRVLLTDTSHQIDQVLTPAQQSKWAIIKTTARQELVKQTRAWRQANRV